MRHRAAALMILFFFCSLLLAQQREQPAAARTTVNRPAQVSFRPDLLNRLRVPGGFQINVFATGAGNPRMMAVGPDGSVYVTRPKQNDLIRLQDKNGDGKSDEMKTIVSGIEMLHGIEIREGKLYLAGVKEIQVRDLNGQNMRRLIGNLPDGGQHANRTIGFGPDGMLYISIGSTCNNCDEANREHATILFTEPDGSSRKIFAKGLRNTIGFDWHPATKEFWGMDHGSDGRGDDKPGEELNRLRQGSNYGWPYCYENRTPDPFTKPPEGTGKEAYCQKTAPPALTYQAHSAPIEMVFYNADQFPDDYKGDAFVAMHGSWNRSTATGYKVVRILFENGKPH
ncbi:MAG TPA: PQQ-dependent sugar dehydrogenase [Acidobacteriota bacterium]